MARKRGGRDDISLGLTAEDRGALSLVRQLLREILNVQKARAQEVASTKEATAVTLQEVAARRAAAAAAKEQARQNKLSAQESARTAAEQRRSSQTALRQAIQDLKDKANLRKAELRQQQDADRAALASSRAQRQASRDALSEQSAAIKARIAQQREADRLVNQQVKAQRQAAQETARAQAQADRAATQAIARQQANLRNQQRAESQAAKERRAAIQEQARQIDLSAKREAASLRAQQTAQQKAARLQQQQIQQQARASQQAARAAQQASQAQIKALQGQGRAVGDLITRVAQLAAAYAGLRSIGGFIQRGLEFNEIIETSTLGIASLITAQANLRTEEGRLLKGTEALGVAQGLAADQINKLRIAGIETAATTEQLVDAFQQAVGAGIKTGLTLDQIRGFTVQIAQAAGAIGLPFNQLNQEVRSILDATIDRNSRIAKTLQLTNQEIRQAKEQGRLAELLNEKFQAFTVAGQETVKTFAAVKSNLSEALDLFSGNSTKPLFEELRRVGLEALLSIFDTKNARIRSSFQGLVDLGQASFREIGTALADGVRAAVEAAQNLSGWLDKNHDAVQATVLAFGTLAREIGGLISDIIGLVTGVSQAGVETGTFVGLLRTATGLVQFLRENIEAIAVVLTGIAVKGLIATAIVNPIGAAVVGVTALVALFTALSNQQENQRRESNRTLASEGERTAQAIRLTTEFAALAKIIDSGKLKEGQLADARRRLANITEELSRLSPAYAKALGEEGQSATEAARKVTELTNARFNDIVAQALAADTQKQALEANLAALRQQLADLPIGRDTAGLRIDVQKQITQQEKDIQFLTARLGVLGKAGALAAEAMKKAKLEAVALTTSLVPTRVEGQGGGKKKDTSLDDEIQRAQGALNRVKKETAAALAENDRLFKSNQKSAREYFLTIEREQVKVLDAEKALQSARLRAGQVRKDQGEINKATEEIEGIEAARVRIHTETLEKIEQFDKQRRADRKNLEIEALRVDGKNVQAAALELAEQYREQLEIAFREQDFESVGRIMHLINRGQVDAQFEELTTRIQRSENELNNSLNRIQIQIDSKTVSTLRGQKLIAEAYKREVEVLTPLVAQLKEMQETQGLNPEQTEQLETLTIRMQELTLAARLAGDTLFRVGVTAIDSLEEGLGTALDDIINSTKSVGDAFRDMALSVSRAVSQIITKLLAQYAVQQLLAGLGISGLAQGGRVGGGQRGNITQSQGLASGGIVRGPGSTTSDSIGPLWLSDKEFVVNAKGYAAFPELVEAINEYGRTGVRRRGLADGGPVVSINQAKPREGSQDTVKIVLEHDADTILRVLGSRKGARVQIRTMQSNPKAVRGSLR